MTEAPRIRAINGSHHHRIYVFVRAEGFYPLELPNDDTARRNAECNPGTLKVLNDKGHPVWPNDQDQDQDPADCEGEPAEVTWCQDRIWKHDLEYVRAGRSALERGKTESLLAVSSTDWMGELEAALGHAKRLREACGGRSDMLPWHLHQAVEALTAALRTQRHSSPIGELSCGAP